MSDDISNRAREAIALAENWAQNSSKVQVLLIENGLEMSRALLSRDAEVARLREALGNARREFHDGQCSSHIQPHPSLGPDPIPCDCGKDAHNTAIDAALRLTNMNATERNLIALLESIPERDWIAGRDLAHAYSDKYDMPMSYGTLYVTMSKLVEAGACESKEKQDSDRRRRYFRVTLRDGEAKP